MTVDEIIDHLYGLPLDEFTAARNEAAAELSGADRDRVKALRKPTAAAGAVNRLVREHRKDVDTFLSASASLRDAQVAGTGNLEEATRQQRNALARLVEAGGEVVRQSLLAAAVDEDAAEELLAGRLERELEPRGFGTLLAQVTPSSRPARPKKPKQDDREARAKLNEAKQELAAAEAEERQAHRRWEQARHELDKARIAFENAERRWQRSRNSSS
jgi:multidrug resistance efflux pump